MSVACTNAACSVLRALPRRRLGSSRPPSITSTGTRAPMYLVQLPKACSTCTRMPVSLRRAVPLTRIRERVAWSSASRPIATGPASSAAASGSPGAGRATRCRYFESTARANPGGPTSSDAHTWPSGAWAAATRYRRAARNAANSGSIAGCSAPRPTRTATSATPARSCTARSPAWKSSSGAGSGAGLGSESRPDTAMKATVPLPRPRRPDVRPPHGARTDLAG